MSLIFIRNLWSECHVPNIKISIDFKTVVEGLKPCGNIAAARDMNPPHNNSFPALTLTSEQCSPNIPESILI